MMLRTSRRSARQVCRRRPLRRGDCETASAVGSGTGQSSCRGHSLGCLVCPDMAPNSSEWYAAHGLDPQRYHHRAPFFAEESDKDRMFISGTQASMDAEISMLPMRALVTGRSAGINLAARCARAGSTISPVNATPRSTGAR